VRNDDGGDDSRFGEVRASSSTSRSRQRRARRSLRGRGER
jgi:hypothetical protein